MREMLTDKNRGYVERTREIALKTVQPIAAELDRNRVYTAKLPPQRIRK